MSDLKERAAKLAEERAKKKKEAEAKAPEKPTPVSAGAVDRIVDVLINPTPEKILEFTDFDRNQVTLIPQLGIIDNVWEYYVELATFRENEATYKVKYEKSYPVIGNMMKRFVFLLAQCRRSLGGKTQKALEDLALADLESRAMEDKEGFGGLGFED